MKRILLYTTLLLSVFNSAFAADSLFVKGNELYSSARYEEAIQAYLKVLDRGVESPELYYNLGNASYRSNKIGYAVLYYRKALKMNPGFEAADKNLAYVSMYLEDKFERVPELFIKRWIKSFFSLFSLRTWSIFSILFFILMLSAILLYVFGNRLLVKKLGFSAALIGTILLIMSLSAAITGHKEVVQPEEAVIVVPSVVVKSTPSDSGTDLFVLHEGSSMTTMETVGEWIEIKIVDGRIGWIPSKAIEII